MGVRRRRRCVWREKIPTRFALASKATSPLQGEVLSPSAIKMKFRQHFGGLLRRWAELCPESVVPAF